MESFYGGRAGFSFVIAKSFSSIEEMKTNFALGPAYTDVHYDEYVIINTINKNSSENGQIFRRGYNYTDKDTHGAIYIGTIVGPAGSAPLLSLATIDEVMKEKEKEGELQDGQPGEEGKRQGFPNMFSEGSYKASDGNLIPGKYLKENNTDGYNDEIKWASYCIKNTDDNSTAYIGFKIPYLVQEFTAVSENAYVDPSVERKDQGDHPFYQHWELKIPKGIKGGTSDKLRVINASEASFNYPGKEDDLPNNNSKDRKILVYDYTTYDNTPEGKKQTLYLGDYNMISSISVDDGSENIDNEGKITIQYTHNNNEEYFLSWVNSIQIDQNGIVTLQYTGNKEDKILDQRLKWVEDIYIDEDIKNGDETILGDYYFHARYNTGESKALGTQSVNYIEKMAINNVNHHLLVYYSNPSIRRALSGANKTVTYEGDPDWLDLGSVKDDAGILVGFNILPTKINSNLESEEKLTSEEIIAYLNDHYPSGVPDGKIVTVGSTGENKRFYAFDYNVKGWYGLGSFDSGTAIWNIVGKEGNISEEQKTNLAIGGVWFIVEGEDEVLAESGNE